MNPLLVAVLLEIAVASPSTVAQALFDLGYDLHEVVKAFREAGISEGTLSAISAYIPLPLEVE